MKGNTGFTLLELMIGIAITGILVAVAVPSFTAMMKSNEGSSDANQLLTVLTIARSEAIRRNQTVQICKSKTASASSPVCDGTAAENWSEGVLMWVDQNSDGAITKNEVLQTLIPLSTASTITVSTSGGLASISYNVDGTVPTGQNTTFKIYPGTSISTKYERCVVISQTGKPRITDNATDSSSCS